MSILNDPKKIREVDKSPVIESVGMLPDQMKQAWNEIMNIKLPVDEFKNIENIVVAGMGGSALGARIIDSLSFEILDLPMEIITGYHLPAYADKKTLVIISSYSGNTEETLSCFTEAIEQNCQIFIITSGGRLAEIARVKKIPAYIFEPRYNPAKQPRLGLGYSITAQLALLSKLKLIRVTEGQITETINYLKKLRTKLTIETAQENNLAKKIASSLESKIIVVVSSEHLNGVAHAFKNMLNENSKSFAVRFSLPEMNHHLLEGLAFPKQNKDILKILFLESEIYDPEIKKRIKITKEVIEKNKIPHVLLMIRGRTRLTQVFETVYLGGFISYYLALLNGVDPTAIPWVDYFKKALKTTAHEEKR